MMKVLLISIFMTFSLSTFVHADIQQVDYLNVSFPIVTINNQILPQTISYLKIDPYNNTLSMDDNIFNGLNHYFMYYAQKHNTDLLAKNQLEIYTKLQSVENRIAQMDPTIITKSISFLVGAFSAIAFVLSSNSRY